MFVANEVGSKRKLKAAVNTAKEKKWNYFSKYYAPVKDIDQTYVSTLHQIAISGWLPDWDLQEAMRELLTNMIDQSRKVLEGSDLEQQELQFSDAPGRLFLHIGGLLIAEARWEEKVCEYVSRYENCGVVKAKGVKVDYKKVKTQRVQLINYGSELSWNSFFIGKSTKRNSKTMIGTHGEGLPGACAVLLRNGCNIFADCTHHRFTATVMTLNSAVNFQLERREPKVRDDLQDCTVRFTIVFDPDREYTNLADLMNCVRLSSTATAAGITTSRGTLLLERTLRGKQFNRSIFVAHDPHCLFGYNFLDPDKNLLQGRDRNSHGKHNLVKECGIIVSEAILKSKAVREEVLECFIYSSRYDPNNPEQENMGQYEDLKDGKYFTCAAVEALRQQHSNGVNSIFCARNSGKLKEITAATGMSIVYSHHLLHNHAAVVERFDTEIVRDAEDIPANSRIFVHQTQIAALLKVNQLKESKMVLPQEQTGIYIHKSVAYVTGLAQLGTAHDTGLSETQEITLNRTLSACSVSMESIVKVVRLLRNKPEHSEPTSTASAHNDAKEASLRANLAAKLNPRSNSTAFQEEPEVQSESESETEDQSEYTYRSCSDERVSVNICRIAQLIAVVTRDLLSGTGTLAGSERNQPLQLFDCTPVKVILSLTSTTTTWTLSAFQLTSKILLRKTSGVGSTLSGLNVSVKVRKSLATTGSISLKVPQVLGTI